MSEIKITKDNFQKEVVESNKRVVVDFWATWCGPCRMLAPVLEEVASEHEDSAIVGKVNVDEEMELAQQFGIQSIPTLIVFEGGKIINTVIGFQRKDDLEKIFK